ncbi:MAG TPA: hypothetical protein VGL76_08690 [Gaiellaceae bacterium]|jgi:hypothetical protein
MRTLLVILSLLVFVPAAGAVGPWLGVATNGEGYQVSYTGNATRIGGITLAGEWGIPRVTASSDGGVGGLSADERTLVLAQQPHPTNDGVVHNSSFLVLRTKPLRVVQTVKLQGDFGFDALSPHGGTLYLIQHLLDEGTFRYRVRAYDLVAHRLLPGVIADKTQRDWLMNGFPVTRATSPGGRWVYTLYSNPDNYPFVHALDTVKRTAVCIGIPLNWTTNQAKVIDNATLRVKGNELLLSSGFAINRTTFRVAQT